MPAPHTVLPTATNSSHFSPLCSCQHFAPLTSLPATFMDFSASCCKHKTYGRAKPFRCNTYKKPGVGGALASLGRLARVGREESLSYSSSFLSHSCALFCTHQKLNSFVFKRFRTLCAKQPGVGYPCDSHQSRQFAFSPFSLNNEPVPQAFRPEAFLFSRSRHA